VIADMPTKNPRVNVVVTDAIQESIAMIAKREGKSISVVAKELIEDALDKHEDALWSQLAMKRAHGTKKTIPHEKAWK
jgi:predicted DNA-binding protein